jgi:predicted dehydrogenase
VSSSKRQIVAAVVGAGFMGEVHSRAARAAGARLHSVTSLSLQSARRLAELFDFGAWGVDATESIDDAVDVVHICSPNGLHYEHALRAIEGGRAVVCEKPLATTAAHADHLAEAARARGVVTAVPFVYRYHSMVREARARIAAGNLGAVLTIDAAYLQDWLMQPSAVNWRTDAVQGGSSRAFADIGSHLCDLIEFVTGQRMESVCARTRRFYAERGNDVVGNEDSVVLLFELSGGAIGSATISQLAPGRKNALMLEVHGALESIRFEQERPDELWIGRLDESSIAVRGFESMSDDARRTSYLPAGHPLGYQDAFNALIADVYATMRGETVDGLPTFEDGARAARLTEVVLQSAREERWVQVPR